MKFSKEDIRGKQNLRINNKKIIAVVISTYNGERFISEQLDSILAQKLNTKEYLINIFLRDDGSTDATLDIVKQYQQKYSDRILLIDSEKQNLGFGRSFLKILSFVHAAYTFFSDQDDVWPVNKVEEFLKVFFSYPPMEPLAIMSDVWIADSKGQSIGKTIKHQQIAKIINSNSEIGLIDQIFDTYVQGSALAINSALLILIKKTKLMSMQKKIEHDHFIGIIASTFGDLYYLDKPLLFYRQTGNNIFGARDLRKKKIIKKICGLFENRVSDTVRVLNLTSQLHLNTISSAYNLSIENKNFLHEIDRLNVSHGFFTRLKFFLKYRRWVSHTHPFIMSTIYALLSRRGGPSD